MQQQPANLGTFGQVLGSLTDYNFASADEDDLGVLRSIAPGHHGYIVEIDPKVCALRSVHFTHDTIAGNSPYQDEHSRAASFDHITPDGMMRSSAFAVLRLIKNSYFVACTTGRSAGFSPLRIRPM
jgi:hypothetical protein